MVKSSNIIGRSKNRIQDYLNKWTYGAPPPKAIIHWRAPEFYFVDKSIVWGIFVAIFFVALAGLLVYFGQILTALVSILFMVVVLKFAYAKPETIEYRIEEFGVRVSGWLHPYYDEIVGFWTSRQNRQPILYLKTKNIITDHLTIPLDDVPVKKITKVLEKYLPEVTPPSTPKIAGTKKRKT